ncbi:spermidine synthase [Lebetimonas sp. JS032]|uniref:spermidine synthase n=1 Tax=Lebetimonas sp. JS032 TaxID=990070 RepID=UPI0004634672|nr:spermidine synthase [Lebetimonas sp. JS032]
MSQIKKEMMALVGACVSEGTKVLAPSEFNSEFKKIITAKFDIFNEDSEEKYDLIIEDKPTDYIKIYQKLNDKGVYITTAESLADKALFENLSKMFYIVLPYYYIEENKIYPLVFASKKPHPTADIIRHRSDFVENTYYYHTDIHLASFVMPKYIFEEIKNFIKM